MAKNAAKTSRSRLKKLENGLAKVLKTKGEGGKKRPKILDKDKSIKKVLKKVEALLSKHKLSWSDLPIAKHFAAEPKVEVKAVPAAKRAARTAAAKKAPAKASKASAQAAKKATPKKAAGASSAGTGAKSSSSNATPHSAVSKAASRTSTKAKPSSAAKSTAKRDPARRSSSSAKPAAKASSRSASPRKAAAKNAAASRKDGGLPPKYKNPKNPSQTWAGRGSKPRWLQEYLAAGGALNDALI